MNNWEEQLKEAFDMVHMEPSLKQSVSAAFQERKPQKVISAGIYWKKAAVVFGMLLVLLTGYGSHMFFKPVSVISIDVNPSIELGINSFDRVVSVKAYNNDAKALTQKLPLQFLKSLDAVNIVLASDEIQAHLSGEEELTLTVVGENEDDSQALFHKLEDSLSSLENVSCHSAPTHVVENAHHCGLSYGKYLAYLEALSQNPELKPEDVQDMTMKEIKILSGNHHSHKGKHTEASQHHASEPETTQPTETIQPTEITQPAEITHHGHSGKTHKSGHH